MKGLSNFGIRSISSRVSGVRFLGGVVRSQPTESETDGRSVVQCPDRVKKVTRERTRVTGKGLASGITGSGSVFFNEEEQGKGWVLIEKVTIL